MKYPKVKKYGSNSDERETCLPIQFDLEGKEEPIAKLNSKDKHKVLIHTKVINDPKKKKGGNS